MLPIDPIRTLIDRTVTGRDGWASKVELTTRLRFLPMIEEKTRLDRDRRQTCGFHTREVSTRSGSDRVFEPAEQAKA